MVKVKVVDGVVVIVNYDFSTSIYLSWYLINRNRLLNIPKIIYLVLVIKDKR